MLVTRRRLLTAASALAGASFAAPFVRRAAADAGEVNIYSARHYPSDQTLFDLFTQEDRSLDRAGGGLGIGLTVARKIVEMHGGAVEARSKGTGQGSEFLVRIPVLAEPREEC